MDRDEQIRVAVFVFDETRGRAGDEIPFHFDVEFFQRIAETPCSVFRLEIERRCGEAVLAGLKRVAEHVHDGEAGEIGGEIAAGTVVPDCGDFTSVAGVYVADDAVRIADFPRRLCSFEEACERVVGDADGVERSVVSLGTVSGLEVCTHVFLPDSVEVCGTALFHAFSEVDQEAGRRVVRLIDRRGVAV